MMADGERDIGQELIDAIQPRELRDRIVNARLEAFREENKRFEAETGMERTPERERAIRRREADITTQARRAFGRDEIAPEEVAKATKEATDEQIKQAAEQGGLNQKQVDALTKLRDVAVDSTKDIADLQNDMILVLQSLDAIGVGNRDGRNQRRRSQRAGTP